MTVLFMLEIDMKCVKITKGKIYIKKEGLYFVYIGKQNCESIGRCSRRGTCCVSSVLNQLRDIQETLDLSGPAPHPGNRLARTGLERTAGGREMSQLTLEGSFWLQELLFFSDVFLPVGEAALNWKCHC